MIYLLRAFFLQDFFFRDFYLAIARKIVIHGRRQLMFIRTNADKSHQEGRKIIRRIILKQNTYWKYNIYLIFQ